MAQAPDFVNPYAGQIASLEGALRALENRPQQPMFSPEEEDARRSKIEQQRMYGQLGMLSNDESVTGIAKPMLAEAIKASEKKQTEHGEYDPVTGKFVYFPEYQQARQRESLEKRYERAANLGSQAEQRWYEQRARAGEALALRQSLAALKTPADPGSLTYVGTHPETGLPITLHSKRGMMYNGQPYNGPVNEKPQGTTAGEREDMSNLTTNIQGIRAAKEAMTGATKASPLRAMATSNFVAGIIADMSPATQAIITSFKTEEQKNAATMMSYISDGIRAGRFGLTLTPHEKASSIQYLPSPYDSPAEQVRKMDKLEALLQKDFDNRKASQHRPGQSGGGLDPRGTGGAAPALPGSPVPTGAAPPAGGLPPGFTIERAD